MAASSDKGAHGLAFACQFSERLVQAGTELNFRLDRSTQAFRPEGQSRSSARSNQRSTELCFRAQNEAVSSRATTFVTSHAEFAAFTIPVAEYSVDEGITPEEMEEDYYVSELQIALLVPPPCRHSRVFSVRLWLRHPRC
jgi:hypothetical protein